MKYSRDIKRCILNKAMTVNVLMRNIRMIYMRKKLFRCILIFCVALSILSGCAKAPQQEVLIYTDYLYYDSIKELKKSADIIVEAKIISTKVVLLDTTHKFTDEEKADPELNPVPNPEGSEVSYSDVYTIYQVEVINKYKGKVKEGDTIEFKCLGGVMSNVKYVEEDVMDINVGETYILFLETYPDSYPSLINQIQGIYKYEDKKITPHKENDIDLKIEDLEEDE